MGETIKSYKVFAGKRDVKRLLGRTRHGWGDIIKNNLKEMARLVWTGLV
jgi:hypothetical protein